MEQVLTPESDNPPEFTPNLMWGTGYIAPATVVATASASVGVGMEFWVTSDGVASPVFVMGEYAVECYQSDIDLVATLYGSFPPPPPARPLEWVDFLLPANGWAFVDHGDGYRAEFTVTGTGWMYSYDDFGTVNDTVEFVRASAQVDMSQNWWVSGLNGERLTGSDYETDALNWHPTHAEPPPIGVSTIAITVPQWSCWNLQFVQDGFSVSFPLTEGSWETATMHNGYTDVPVTYGGAHWFTYEAVDGDGQWLYSTPA
jgi:hypothetical protein